MARIHSYHLRLITCSNIQYVIKQDEDIKDTKSYIWSRIVCSLDSVRSSMMIPPAVKRGTARFSSAFAFSGLNWLFWISARESSRTLDSLPWVLYSQLISASSPPRGVSKARRTNPRDRTYAFSLYSRLTQYGGVSKK